MLSHESPIALRDYASRPAQTGPHFVLACPECGGENTHLNAVAVSARREQSTPNEIRVDAITGEVETFGADEVPQMRGPHFVDGIGRRHRIALLGYCEGGHEFSLVFGQHKGETLVEASSEPNGTYPEDQL